jgi:predicted nucleic acid-binding protein
MRVFVDTSAFLAVVNRDDRHHAQAREIWEHLNP